MREVSFAQFFGFGVVFQIVITIRQAESALIGFGDHLGRVLEVLIRAEGEQGSAALERRRELCGGGIFRKILLRLQTRDAFHLRQERLDSELLNGWLVHAGGVIIASFLGDAIARDVRFRSIFQNRPQLGAILVLELAVRAPTRLVWRNGILLDPPAAGVGVEVHARIDGAIHGGNIQNRFGGGVLGEGGHGG